MKELQEIIIGCCYGEDKYNNVSFLEPNDFDNFQGSPFREYFKILQETKANKLFLLESLKKCGDRNIQMMLGKFIHILGVNNLYQYAIALLEDRFKRLLATLLYDLSMRSTKAAERDLLNEASISIISSDIFVLSDSLIEYLGAHGSEYTKSRINGFLDYRNKRINTAKKTINEFS